MMGSRHSRSKEDDFEQKNGKLVVAKGNKSVQKIGTTEGVIANEIPANLSTPPSQLAPQQQQRPSAISSKQQQPSHRDVKKPLPNIHGIILEPNEQPPQ
eukprot:m.8470 g.8470  ORF g.8470 m.8470 type:complete len:99 (+) comp3139_c1_seq1:100-396(+)